MILSVLAITQSRRAKAGELRACQISYAADMLLAARELEANNLGQASALLNRQIPQPGDKDLRGWEWRHLWARCRSDELFTLGTHSYEVTALAFLPNGRLVTGSLLGLTDDITVKLWDPRTRRLLATSPFKKAVSDVAVSPDGKTIAVGTWLTEVGVLDAQSLQVQRNLWAGNFVSWVKFSPNGDYLATCGDQQVDLWDAATLDHLATLPGRRAIAFSPDGTILASQAPDGRGLVLWRTSDRKAVAAYETVLGDLSAIAFTPDGRRLAAASSNGRGYLLNRENNTVTVLTNATAALRSVAFSPDGTILATSGADQTIRIYEAATAKFITSLKGCLGLIARVAFSPDGKFLASASKDSTIRVWDPKRSLRPYVTTNFPALQPGFAVSRNGRYLVTPDLDGDGRVWDLTTLREKSRFVAGEAARFDAICPNGRFVARGETNGAVTIWDTVHDGKSYTRPLHRTRVNVVEFSPDGLFAASANSSTSATNEATVIWEVETGKVKTSMPNYAFCLAFSKDGTLLFSGQGEGWLSVWDVPRQERKAYFRAHAFNLVHIAVSPDGRIIATASIDESVALWDAESLNRLATFSGLGGDMESVAFSPDGQRLAAGLRNGTARLWDIESRQEVGRFASAGGTLVRFRADGDCLLTCRGTWVGGGYYEPHLTNLISWLAPSFQEIEAEEKAKGPSP